MSSVSKRCFYEVLQVSKTATPDEIKKSFRKLAIKWHPDKNQDNKEQASEKFRELSEAYEHLSDEVKKKEYDIYGHAGQKKYTQSTFSTTRADDIFKAFFSQFGFDSAFDQDIFGKRYGANTFTRRDFGSMGSNYEDILKGFSNGTAKPSYTRANTYGSGYTYGTTTGGKTTYTTSSGTGSSYGTTGGRTYVRVGSTGGYGSYGGYGTSTGSGTVIGGDQEVTKENVRNKWANRFDDQDNNTNSKKTDTFKTKQSAGSSDTAPSSTSSLSDDGTTKIQTTVSKKNGITITTTKTTTQNSDGSRNINQQVVEQGVPGRTIRKYTLPAGCPDIEL